jgi:hypothetical protein
LDVFFVAAGGTHKPDWKFLSPQDRDDRRPTTVAETISINELNPLSPVWQV